MTEPTTKDLCPYCHQVHPVVDGKRVFGCSTAAFAPAAKKSPAQLRAAARRHQGRKGWSEY